MLQIKPHKTVEQIAKKHQVDVSFIKKQLDMGEPIEHEHTKDHDLARDIALQHLDEIPDYYTRLKKLEASAKKIDKKFKSVKEELDGKSAKDPNYSLRDWFKGGGWVQAGGKYDGKPCAKQPGQTTKPFCRDPDDRAKMSKKEKNKRSAKKRREDPNPNRKGKAKMVNDSYNPNVEQLDELWGKVAVGAGAALAPYLLKKFAKPSVDKAIDAPANSKDNGIINKLKQRRDKMNQLQSYELKGKVIDEKKDACYNKVKSRYKIWPSAYASGALVKCRKVGASNWGTKSEQVELQRYCPKCGKSETREECKYGPKYWEMFSVPMSLSSDAYDPNRPHPANEEKDHEHSMARRELSIIISAAKRLRKKMKGEGNIEAWVQSKITRAADYIDSAADYIDSGKDDVEESCWKGYKRKKGTKKFSPGSCVKEGYSNWREELSINPTTFEFIDLIKPDPLKPTNGVNTQIVDEDWQSINRKDKTDGLSQKAVNAYRKENPGSKLQTAVTEKNPTGSRKDRKNAFCSRMSGMKQRLTSAETARDPDSRINKALRRWNCN